MVLLSIFLLKSDPQRIISELFFIHFVIHALALHLAVKYLTEIFLYEDLTSTLALHTSLGCISLQECQQDRTLLRNQYY